MLPYGCAHHSSDRTGPVADAVTKARDLLAPIHDWFTEGFDTPVLQDAKVLLDQLV